MGDPKAGSTRRRAVGTRDRILSHLALAGEVSDDAGMASSVLAREVGYPGSSIAFAQLLSGMERAGLIRREVRGKRTYRITAVDGAARPATAIRRRPALRAATGAGVSAFDYDELARRLLVQVVRQLATGPGELAQPVAAPPPGDGALADTIAGLEQELASVRTSHGTLSEENARLREQLRDARRSLARAQEQAGARQITDELNATEVGLLDRLLSPAPNPTPAEDLGA